jgi:hypothetical protein
MHFTVCNFCSIDPLYIEDPFDFENNVGSTCFRIQQIVKVQQPLLLHFLIQISCCFMDKSFECWLCVVRFFLLEATRCKSLQCMLETGVCRCICFTGKGTLWGLFGWDKSWRELHSFAEDSAQHGWKVRRFTQERERATLHFPCCGNTQLGRN